MQKTPWHLWAIGILSLVWNAGGAMDYTMTKLRVAAYLEALPEAALRMLDQAPTWFDVTWPIGVWFSVIGSILLLARSRFAGAAFAISLLGLIGSSIYTYGMAEVSMLAVGGTAAVVFAVAIPVVLIALWIYARAMTRRGVLR
ncbi:MAG: hypothetical protein AAFU41_10665 [Pseudomonadota bacterium]